MIRWVLAAMLLAGPAAADCRLALALGFDVSRSVSARDYRIQKGGVVAALTDPVIRDALLKPAGHVALAVFEWSGPDYQETVLPWTMIAGTGDLTAVVAVIEAHDRDPKGRPTGLGAALAYAHGLIAAAPDCAAQTLDISGDGRNNAGLAPARIYETEDFGDLVVNGLAIGGYERDLPEYMAQELIRGPSAFVETAPDRDDFPAAFRRKLERELTEQIVGSLTLPPSRP